MGGRHRRTEEAEKRFATSEFLFKRLSNSST